MINKTTFKASTFAFDSIAYREKNELSRRQLADKLGTTKNVIRHFEQRQNRPRMELVISYCELMGSSIDKYFKN